MVALQIISLSKPIRLDKVERILISPDHESENLYDKLCLPPSRSCTKGEIVRHDDLTESMRDARRKRARSGIRDLVCSILLTS